MSTTASQLSHATTLGTVKLRAAARTDVGRRRSENQDSYGYLHSALASLYVVADGMGGARGGGTASAMAVNVILDGAVEGNGEITFESLEHIISLSNKVIYSRSQGEPQLSGMGTTVVALALVKDRPIVAHVGDSRIYLLRGDSLVQLTRDHTLVQELVDTGAIPPQDAANHPIAHMLTRSLGPTEAISVEIHVLPEPVRPGDKFLLCSDGLYNHVTNDDIARLLREKDPVTGADELIQLALDGGGSDNVTLQIVEVLNLSDETVSDARPENGAVKKFISSEIDVQTVDGKPLIEYTRLRDVELRSQPKVEPPAEHAAAASVVNGHTRLTGRTGEQTQEGQTMVISENVAEYLNSISDSPRPNPAQFALVIALGVFTAFVAYWFFFIPVSTTRVDQHASSNPSLFNQPDEQPPAASSSSSLPAPDAQLEHELLAYDPGSEPKNAIGDGASSSIAPPDLGAVEVVPNKTPDIIVAPPVEPTEAEILTDNLRKFSEILSAASDIHVAPAPRLSLGGEGSTRPLAADQPIVWDRETRMIEKIMNGQQPVLPGETLGGEPAKLRTDEETVQLADKKEQLRERIADIDAKLELLVSETKEQAKNKQTRVEMEISRMSEAKAALEDEMRATRTALENWEQLQKKSAETEPLKFADDVAVMSEEVKQKRAAYSDATEQYLAATDKWQANPKDTELAAMMAALGRDIKTKRLELETAVATALNRGLIVADRRLQRLRFEIGNLKRRQDQLNRHVGLLRAFAPSPLPRRKEMQRKLLEERAAAIESLKQVTVALSDEEELLFRLKNSELFYTAA